MHSCDTTGTRLTPIGFFESPSKERRVCLGISRCHPEIAAISNAHFYGGRLLDGCSAADRQPLVRGLPPLLCLDVCGSQEYAGGSHSASNRAEASAVVQVALVSAFSPCKVRLPSSRICCIRRKDLVEGVVSLSCQIENLCLPPRSDIAHALNDAQLCGFPMHCCSSKALCCIEGLRYVWYSWCVGC